MENITKAINRLLKFIEYKEITVNKFSQIIDVSNSYFSKMVRNNASIGSNILEKIVRTFPEIDANWLLTGEGKMLKEHASINIVNEEHTPYNITLPPGPCQQCELRQQIIDVQQKTIQELEWHIETLGKNKK